jgi:hypothetical protein
MAYGILASLLLNKILGGGGEGGGGFVGDILGSAIQDDPATPAASEVGGGMLKVDDVVKKRKGQMDNTRMLEMLSELLASRIGGSNGQ